MYFSPDLFRFLQALKRNNNREWFNEHKHRYEQFYRQAMLDFLKDLAPRMRSFSADYPVDIHPTRGAFMRIYRDTRFSHNKIPYKTYLSAHISYKTTRKNFHGPSIYFHIEKGDCFLAAGVWQPEKEAQQSIRARISMRGKEWKKVTKNLRLSGSSLKRAPKGWDPNHPLIEEIRRKDFICVIPLTEKEILSKNLPAIFVKKLRKAKPLLNFITSALEN